MNPPASLGTAETVTKPAYNAGNAATGGVWLVRGTRASAVLKIARPPSDPPAGSPAWQTSDDPEHWNYWRRESLAYASGLAARAYADAGIAPPELLDWSEQPDGSVALWLAEVDGAAGITWAPERLGEFARRLGLAQAGWAGRVPQLPWLSRRWLAQYVGRTGVWVRWDVDWSHPLARVWPPRVREDLARLWAERDAVLAAAGTAPRTLAHLDVWPMNLIDSTAGFTLLDWAFVGEGGLGEDAANLIVDSVTDGYFDMALLPSIADAVTGGYLAGLREGGFGGSLDGVRTAIHAYGAAKYSWFAPAILGQAIHEGNVGNPQYGVRGTVEQELERLTGLVTMLADWTRR